MRTGLPTRIPVLVRAEDPVSRAGVESQLRYRPEIELLTEADAGRAAVAVLVVTSADDDALVAIRALRRAHDVRVLLLATTLDDAGLFSVVEAGVNAVLRRGDATPEQLTISIQSAAKGDGSLPPDMIGRLLSHVQNVQHHLLGPRGLTLHGFSQRELAVLRLIAEGHSTGEIASALCYSERTIKSAIHDLVTRLQLRNRSHAVAFAVRAGLI